MVDVCFPVAFLVSGCAPVRLKLCSCLYSSRCLRDHTRQAPHAAHKGTQYGTNMRSIASLSLSLSLIFEPCLYSSRPRPRSCESWTKLFSSHPPSLAQPTRPAVRRTVSYHRYRFSLRVAMGSRRTSPIDFVGAPQVSQPYALPDRTSYTVCFVCLFVRAVPL